MKKKKISSSSVSSASGFSGLAGQQSPLQSLFLHPSQDLLDGAKLDWGAGENFGILLAESVGNALSTENCTFSQRNIVTGCRTFASHWRAMIEHAQKAPEATCPWRFSLLRTPGTPAVLCTSLTAARTRTSAWRPKTRESDVEIAHTVIASRVRRQQLLKIVLVDNDWALGEPGQDVSAGNRDRVTAPHKASVFVVCPQAAREMLTAMAAHALTPGTGPVSPVLQHVINAFSPETPSPFAKPWHDEVHENAWMHFIVPNPGRIRIAAKVTGEGAFTRAPKRKRAKKPASVPAVVEAVQAASAEEKENEKDEFVEEQGPLGEGDAYESDFFASDSDDAADGPFPGPVVQGASENDDAPCAAFVEFSQAPSVKAAQGEEKVDNGKTGEEENDGKTKKRKKRRGNRGVCGPHCSCLACYEALSSGLRSGAKKGRANKEEDYAFYVFQGEDEGEGEEDAPAKMRGKEKRTGSGGKKAWHAFSDRLTGQWQSKIAASCTAYAFAVRVACVSPEKGAAGGQGGTGKEAPQSPVFSWREQTNIEGVLLENLRTKMRVDAPYQVPVSAAALVFDAAMYFCGTAALGEERKKGSSAHLRVVAERIRETPPFQAAGTTCGQLAAMVQGVAAVYRAVLASPTGEAAGHAAAVAAQDAGFGASLGRLAHRCAELFWPAQRVLRVCHTSRTPCDARHLLHVVPTQRVSAGRVRFVAQRYRMMGAAERANEFCVRYGAEAMVAFEFTTGHGNPWDELPVGAAAAANGGNGNALSLVSSAGLHALPSVLELVTYVRNAAPYAKDGADFLLVHAPGAQKSWVAGTSLALLCTPHLSEVLCLGQVLFAFASFSYDNANFTRLQGFWHELFSQKKTTLRGKCSAGVSPFVPHAALRPALAVAAALHKYAAQVTRNRRLLSCLLHSLWVLFLGTPSPATRQAPSTAYREDDAERVLSILDTLVGSLPDGQRGHLLLLETVCGARKTGPAAAFVREGILFSLAPTLCDVRALQETDPREFTLRRGTEEAEKFLHHAFPKAKRDTRTGAVLLVENWRDRYEFAEQFFAKWTPAAAHGATCSAAEAFGSLCQAGTWPAKPVVTQSARFFKKRANPSLDVSFACSGAAKLAECIAVALGESCGGVGNEGGVPSLEDAFPTLFSGSLFVFGTHASVVGTHATSGALSGARVTQEKETFTETSKGPLPRPMGDVVPGMIEAALVNFWPAL